MDFLALKREISEDWQALAAWRREAREDFAFFAGDQWTDEERAALESAGRVAITFNRVAPIIEAVVGSEINNRTEVRYIPRQLGDAGVNELFTGAAQWFRDEASAEEEESDSFQDCVIGGLGWTETRLDTDDSPDGEPRIERIDPFEMGYDRFANARNLRDAKRVFRVRTLPLSEAKEMFPGKTAQQLDASGWIRPDSDRVSRNRAGDEYAGEPDNERDDERDTVTIVQVQWRERERYHLAIDPMTGERIELDANQAKAVRKAMQDVRMIEAKRWRIMQAFLGGEELERGAAPCQVDFCFQAITGKRDRNKRMWYGLMRPMRDPQKWANKWLVQTLHIMNSNSKGGVFAEADAVDDHRAFEDDYAQPDTVHWLKPGALVGGKIMPKPQAPFPAGFHQLTDFAVSSIPDATGVNMEMLGLRDVNQPGILEAQRKQSALTILAKLFDSLRGYRKRQGRVLLEYITEYLSDGRLIRIVGDEGMQYVPLVRDPDVVRYDVIVDDSPTSPNQKEQTWAFLQQVLPAIGKMLDRQDWLSILKYSPLPESFVAEFQERQMQPDPMQQQAAQTALEKEQSEVAENMSTARLNEARAAQIAAEAQVAPMQAVADLESARAQTIKAKADAMSATFGAMNMPQQMELERFRAVSDADAKRTQGLAALMRPMGQAGPQNPSA